jgi:hypothetical protein
MNAPAPKAIRMPNVFRLNENHEVINPPITREDLAINPIKKE